MATIGVLLKKAELSPTLLIILKRNHFVLSVFLKKLFITLLVTSFIGCAQVKKEPIKESTVEQETTVVGDQYWTLDFTYFYKGKETQTVIWRYEHRRDCFEAMFKMKKEASQKPHHSGGGYCKKLFVDGQERTDKDQLGYR